MANGIAKGVGEQFGELGKQIAHDVVSIPAKITGFDKSSGTQESAGAGTGGKKQSNTKQKPAPAKIQELKQQDEVQKQQQLAQARQLLQQFLQPAQQPESSLKEKLEMEDMEKKKKEIEEEKKKAKMQLSQVASKPKRGNLYGIKQKQFAGELGKNAKAQ